MVTQELVQYQQHDHLAVLTIDDGKRNALSPEVLAQIYAALDRAEADKAAVIITGREDVFSAGFDLNVMRRGGLAPLRMLRAGYGLTARVMRYPYPVIAACNGHCLAMGVFLMLSTDYVFGTRGDFKISANEVAIGMTMPRTAAMVLKNRLKPAAYQRAVTLAEYFDVESALDAGFFDRLVERDELMAAAESHARELLKLDAYAHTVTKRRIRKRLARKIRRTIPIDLIDAAGQGLRAARKKKWLRPPSSGVTATSSSATTPRAARGRKTPVTRGRWPVWSPVPSRCCYLESSSPALPSDTCGPCRLVASRSPHPLLSNGAWRRTPRRRSSTVTARSAPRPKACTSCQSRWAKCLAKMRRRRRFPRPRSGSSRSGTRCTTSPSSARRSRSPIRRIRTTSPDRPRFGCERRPSSRATRRRPSRRCAHWPTARTESRATASLWTSPASIRTWRLWFIDCRNRTGLPHAQSLSGNRTVSAPPTRSCSMSAALSARRCRRWYCGTFDSRSYPRFCSLYTSFDTATIRSLPAATMPKPSLK